MGQLAERVGFEPTVGANLQRFSRPPRSTTPSPLRALGVVYVAGWIAGRARMRKGQSVKTAGPPQRSRAVAGGLAWQAAGKRIPEEHDPRSGSLT
jgi:hypothetical protein